MTKREKREARRNERFKKLMESGLGAQIITCPKCSAMNRLAPLDGWMICDSCGTILYRKLKK